MTSFTLPQKRLQITCEDGFLVSYQFGTNIAKHNFCKKCGVFTFVQTRLNPGEYRVNIGCIEGINLCSLEVEEFDGRVI